jgi:general secretion pathway protein G
MYLRRTLAFTIIEVIIVVALMATLSAIVIPLYSNYTKEARILKAVVDIRLMEEAIASFERQNGRLPDSMEEFAHLIDVDKPDSWGYPYVYVKMIYDGKKKPINARKDKFLKPLNTDYDLYSIGPDGLTKDSLDFKDSLDDVVRAADGEYVGLASEF